MALRGGIGDSESGREMEKVGKRGYLKELWLLFDLADLTIKRAKTILGSGALDGNCPLNSIVFVKESETIKEFWGSGKTTLLPLSKYSPPSLF